jgi:chromosome segregation ATPase
MLFKWKFRDKAPSIDSDPMFKDSKKRNKKLHNALEALMMNKYGNSEQNQKAIDRIDEDIETVKNNNSSLTERILRYESQMTEYKEMIGRLQDENIRLKKILASVGELCED